MKMKASVDKKDDEKGIQELINRNFKCYMGWREKPLGTGEAAFIIIPLDEDLTDYDQMSKLCKILRVSHFSEEFIDFTVPDLDK